LRGLWVRPDNAFMIHYGNGNHKRKITKCGREASPDDSTNPKKVSCWFCIKDLLITTTLTGQKKEVWENRLKELNGNCNACKKTGVLASRFIVNKKLIETSDHYCQYIFCDECRNFIDEKLPSECGFHEINLILELFFGITGLQT